MRSKEQEMNLLGTEVAIQESWITQEFGTITSEDSTKVFNISRGGTEKLYATIKYEGLTKESEKNFTEALSE